MATEKDVVNRRLDRVETLARKILATEPDNVDALNSLGLILMDQQSYAGAIDFFRRAIDIGNDRQDLVQNFIRALTSYTKFCVKTGAYDSAESELRKAIKKLPETTALYCHLSYVLSRLGKYSEAQRSAEKALEFDNAYPHAHDVRGLALRGLGQLDNAMDAFERALDINPEFVSAIINKGQTLMTQGEIEFAIVNYEKAIQIDPENEDTFNSLGLALFSKGCFLEAESNLRTAIKINPEFAEAHFNLSRSLLMVGSYEEGWRENEWRWKCSEFPSEWRNFPYSRWYGEPISGKTILVWSEQGIGDEIMFANPIPDLLASGAGLVIECGERLTPLFSRSFQPATVVARMDPPHKAIRQAQIDYQIPMASLCAYYRNSVKDFKKNSGSYLSADPIRVTKLCSRYKELGRGPLVGICWRSGNPIVGSERSVPLKLWDRILSFPNCRFLSLQYGEVEEELESVRTHMNVNVYQDSKINPLKDVEDWFAQIAAVDLVISIDNSTIQVSGSQGIPTWTLVNSSPEWRFGIKGSDHDWHPSVRVYRQKIKGDWSSVFEKLSADFNVWLYGNC